MSKITLPKSQIVSKNLFWPAETLLSLFLAASTKKLPTPDLRETKNVCRKDEKDCAKRSENFLHAKNLKILNHVYAGTLRSTVRNRRKFKVVPAETRDTFLFRLTLALNAISHRLFDRRISHGVKGGAKMPLI